MTQECVTALNTNNVDQGRYELLSALSWLRRSGRTHIANVNYAMAYQFGAGRKTKESWMLMALMTKMRCQDNMPSWASHKPMGCITCPSRPTHQEPGDKRCVLWICVLTNKWTQLAQRTAKSLA
jgi:hypothetical protein